MAIRVDEAKCDGCGECVAACPVEGLQLQDGKPVLDEDQCVECGVCEGACPTGALELVEAA